MMKNLLNNKVEDIEVSKGKSISQLLREMSKTSFQGRTLGEAANVWEEMLNQEELTIIMGLAGSMSTAGQYKIVKWLIENRFIDVLVSTGANISEDIIPAMGSAYYRGDPNIDDEVLLKAGVVRYYDTYGTEIDYTRMEYLILDCILRKTDPDKPYSSAQFLSIFGKHLNEKGIDSIVSAAWRNDVPVFCPAIADSAYGEAFLMALNKGHRLIIDGMKDFEQLMKVGELSRKTGVIYIGGGVPKDITQLMTVSLTLKNENIKIEGKNGGRRESTGEWYYPHKYAIQITTDNPVFGGLSGCTLEEAISWGKISRDGRRVTCYCDATIALPLIAHALCERVEKRRFIPNLKKAIE
jgi:deoxyhypusine synthase